MQGSTSVGRQPASRRSRLFAWRTGTASLTGALLFFAASLVPSLLPRPWYMQGSVAGLAIALGHAAGGAVGSLGRRWIGKLPATSPPLALRLTAVALAGLLAIWCLVLHWRWQVDVRRIMGMEGNVAVYAVGLVAVAVSTGAVVVLIARSIRIAVGAYRRWLTRFLSPGLAVLLTVVSVAVTLVVGFDQLVADRLFVALDRAYLSASLRYEEDVSRPTSALRSGGPGSLIEWESMGSQGRAFVAQGPDTRELADFAGGLAMIPIRVYAGLGSADTATARAELAVAELERTDAFDRELIVLVLPTGTGWVDPYAVDPLEYMYAGDTAAVAVQYSHRPSWMVMIGNQDVAIEAGSALLEAVSTQLRELPETERPRLVIYGESLGSFGLEALFDDVEDVRDRTDGALWVGPPRSNRIWSRLVGARDPDSPVWRPVYEQGQAVRFGADGADLRAGERPWEAPRIAYLQHPSDPITWLSGDVMTSKPEWLEEPRGGDVSRHMPYIPVVTFWQMVVDLIMGTSAPIGHGHKFGPAQAEAWALIVPPERWADSDTARLVAVSGPDEEAGEG